MTTLGPLCPVAAALPDGAIGSVFGHSPAPPVGLEIADNRRSHFAGGARVSSSAPRQYFEGGDDALVGRKIGRDEALVQESTNERAYHQREMVRGQRQVFDVDSLRQHGRCALVAAFVEAR